MRQRFLDKYIRISDGHGISLPASWVKNQTGNENDELEYRDKSLRHIGWHLAMLPTEQQLLVSQNQPTSENGIRSDFA
jgi:hypothetical protein